MDLSTRYLGLDLSSPIMAGACPLADDLDTVRRLEDAGSAAIVLRSLFEEQITGEQLAHHHHVDATADAHAEALSYLPEPDDFVLGPVEYLEQIGRIREIVSVPVIASLNGTTPGGWVDHARDIEQAGADALELNLYHVAVDPRESAAEVEARMLALVGEVVQHVSIPVAVKLSPFFTALAHFAERLDEAGAGGLVLFNRFYQPDIDVDELELVPHLELSRASELTLRLRWLAILSGRVRASLAASGGVHGPVDAVKALMAGADAVQMVSAVLHGGTGVVRDVREGLRTWLVEHEYESLAQLRGSMNLTRCPEPSHLERGNYIRVLQSWRS